MIIKKYHNLQLSIDDSLIQHMAELAIKHYPNEYGGILLGRYSSDLQCLQVHQYLLIDSYYSNSVEFVRQCSYTQEYFNHIFQENGLYYVGEWHSHPDSSAWFSVTDLQAMRNIALCHTVQLENPRLLILSISEKILLDFNFFIFNENRLNLYESN